MSFGACKVIINQELAACMESFHELQTKKEWDKLKAEDQDKYTAAIVDIETEAVEKYKPVLDELATAMDGR